MSKCQSFYVSSAGLPEGVSCAQLVNLTIDFFKNQPSLREKLQRMLEFSSRHSQQVSAVSNVSMYLLCTEEFVNRVDVDIFIFIHASHLSPACAMEFWNQPQVADTLIFGPWSLKALTPVEVEVMSADRH